MRNTIIALIVALMPVVTLAQETVTIVGNDSGDAQIKQRLQLKRDMELKAEEMQKIAERQREAVDNISKTRDAISAITADKIYLNLNNDPFQYTPVRYRGVQGWWTAVDQYSRLTNDPTNMAVAAVLQASEMLKPRGADAQIEYFGQLLPQVKNETVRRAIRLQLIDAYKLANNPEKALDELQTLITGAPKGK